MFLKKSMDLVGVGRNYQRVGKPCLELKRMFRVTSFLFIHIKIPYDMISVHNLKGPGTFVVFFSH